MSRKLFAASMAPLCVTSLLGAAAAQVYPPNCSCTVTYRRTYPANSQLAGQPVQYVTIAPDGRGETFSNANGVAEPDGLPDIGIEITLRNMNNQPIPGIPSNMILLWNSALCICPGGNLADAATNINGVATFTGTLIAGGCVSNLQVWAEGQYICTLSSAGVTVKTNSTDYAHQGTSPCFVDASDLSYLATILGTPAAGLICSDFNEQGANIDASDLAYFAFFLGADCPP